MLDHTTAANKPTQTMSRIENDVELVKRMVERVGSIIGRTVRHARSLGYFEPPKDATTSAPQPVVTTMADALQALDRALDHASGALNVFD